MKTRLSWLLLPAAAVLAATVAVAQQAYPTADAASQALVDALGTDKADPDKLATVLGKQWRDYIPSDSVERKDVDAFLRRYQERHSIETGSDGKPHLVVGREPWVLPVPLQQSQGGWSFDLKGGVDEMRVRRIGNNELAVMQALRAYHDAQTDYAKVDRDGDGVLEYAQKFVSSDGAHDGLFWADDDSGEISPLGPLFGDETPKGQWHGYHFRILDAQGPSAPGGAYRYRIGNDMSRGFALVAWPARYNDTGVMSFMISHEGEIFEKDLGAQGDRLARTMKSFDPDDSWNLDTPTAAAP
ncbi:MAG TPA: DUF2950 domain-containing protein [Pseudoxanthomonas sp.]|jgi:hypothetical protein|nr:DUF2950 domain-containing protein [Pseudoxanthomonas sp.]